MLKLRLKLIGRRGQPCYRIIVTDSRVKRDGRAIEEVGFYNPITKETHLKIDRIVSRLEKGAQPSDTVRDLLVKAKVL
jgi:small subunit ribosomal protein S16|tara:strand:+ start:1412 stop:1645 length:234 start_codon:yes stop_codon:yes gene_type:complete